MEEKNQVTDNGVSRRSFLATSGMVLGDTSVASTDTGEKRKGLCLGT